MLAAMLNARARALLAALMLVLPVPGSAADPAESWRLETWERPFDYESAAIPVDYTPLGRASQQWRICVSYPHLKDSYWLSVNHGMVEEARRLDVSFRLVEAGGYPLLDRQLAQIRDCVAQGADALIVGTVSFHGATPLLTEIARRIPVIAAINDIADAGVMAKVGVSWTALGRETARILARRHPTGSAPVRIAWFPGPRGAGWVDAVSRGFLVGLAESSASIAVEKWGDTGKEIQATLIEEALEDHPDIDYIVGTAPTAEAAVSILRGRGREDRIGVIAMYMTHAVDRGIRRGRIIGAPTDFPVIQGRLAIEVAVRAIEGNLVHRHLGPAIRVIEGQEVARFPSEGTLAPGSFMPRFNWP